jgi:hypothetical protein
MHKSGFTFLVQDYRYSADGLLVSRVRLSRVEIWGQYAEVGVHFFSAGLPVLS